jgi:hypothetical protein
MSLNDWLFVAITFIPAIFFGLDFYYLYKSKRFLGFRKYSKWMFATAAFSLWPVIAIASAVNIAMNNIQAPASAIFFRYALLFIAPAIGGFAKLTLVKEYYDDFRRRLGQG